MSNLFIVGNGFDLSHGLPTTYQDFKNYLICKYPNRLSKNYIPEIEDFRYLTKDSDEYAKRMYCENDAIGVLINLMDEAHEFNEWNKFEFHLGKLRYETYLIETKPIAEAQKTIDYPDYYADKNRNPILSKLLLLYFEKLNEIFQQWICTIDIGQCKKNMLFNSIINIETDCFLSFNYTNVIEQIYNAKNVCHIHGNIDDNIVIGHGSCEAIDEQYYEDNYQLSSRDIIAIHNLLQKNVNKCMCENQIFFSSLEFVNIYSYGFSFSNVDMPYIIRICQGSDTKNSTWFLSSYETAIKRVKHQQLILSAG